MSSTSSATTAAAPAAKPKCPMHSQPITKLCRKCETLICDQCADHKDHEAVTVMLTITEIIETKAFANPIRYILQMNGKENDNYVNKGEVYDVKEDKWTDFKQTSKKGRYEAALVGLPDGIMAYGHGIALQPDFYSYKERKWELLPASLTQRDRVANTGVFANGFVYLIGGYNPREQKVYDTAERYEVKTKTWSTMNTTLNVGRAQHCCVVGPDGQHIYVIGGATRDKTVDVPLKGMEVLDVQTGVFTKCAPMKTTRRLFAASLASDGRIYVFGGVTTGNTKIALCECYDPIKDVWSDVKQMPEARSSHTSCATEEGKIFLLGGSLGGTWQTKENWMFDIVSQVWAKKTPMRIGRCDVSCVPYFPLPEPEEQ